MGDNDRVTELVALALYDAMHESLGEHSPDHHGGHPEQDGDVTLEHMYMITRKWKKVALGNNSTEESRLSLLLSTATAEMERVSEALKRVEVMAGWMLPTLAPFQQCLDAMRDEVAHAVDDEDARAEPSVRRASVD